VPDTADQISKKQKMETLFEIANFNATTCTVFPHGDLGERYTGLKEGFHVLRTRTFLKRDSKASLFRTNTQTFYYTQRRAGKFVPRGKCDWRFGGFCGADRCECKYDTVQHSRYDPETTRS
jgi:hypothetical protein